jgi:hypothetical protein
MTQETIITAIQTCARRLGHPPSRAELTRMTGIGWNPIWVEFRGMRKALRAAGLTPGPKGEPADEATLLLDWARVLRRVQRLPTRAQYKEFGRHSSGTLHRRIGWGEMARRFYRLARQRGIQAEWQDVLDYIARKVLKRKGRRIHWRGETPAADTAVTPSTIASAAITRAVTSGASISSRAANSVRSRVASAVALHPISDPDDEPSPALADRLVYGNPLSLAALAHEPVNEDGVIFLFGILAERMGFRVESIQAGYPDCEAKRLVEQGRWQRVLIEFEYASRNFKEHEHDADLCDIIVCWKHNWIQCPKTLEVIELSKVLLDLAREGS